MMLLKRRIMLLVKEGEDSQPLILRTSLIAERLNADVILMESSYGHLDGAAESVAQLEAALRDTGIKVQRYVRKHRDALKDLILEAAELECGLLIKSPDHSRGLADMLLTPWDWKLLRYAPCPVLIVKQSQSWQGRRLLAAIDAAPGNQAHDELNEQIIQLAALIADLSSSSMELIAAYPTPMQSGSRSQRSSEQVREIHLNQAQQLCQKLAIEPVTTIIEEGPAETLIPAKVEEREVALLVLGTVARRGIHAALLGGNTAEAILSKLHCDVLCVQPKDGDQVLGLLRSSLDSTDAP